MTTSPSWTSQYTVSLLPRNHKLVNQFAVWVQNAGIQDEWIVFTNACTEAWSVPDRSGISYRVQLNDPKWRTSYVHDLNAALLLAWQVAAIHTVNGRTAAQVLAQEGDSTDEHTPAPAQTVGPRHLDDRPRSGEDSLAASFAEPDRPGRHRRD